LKREVDSDYSDEAEIERIKQMAADVFGIDVDKTFEIAAEYNIIGAKSEQILFSLRLDSLTCFVQDKRFGFNSELGYFRGNDQTQLEIAHNILEKLTIPKSEIAKERIVTEKNQEAEVDRNNMNVIRKSEIGEGKNFVKIYRQIEGNSVWSSNLLLALTKDNRIGFMQLHWPEIPHHTINETHRLRYKLEHGWNVPEEKDYKIESAEAGIIHSPAMSFFMDIYPAIRVIYKPTMKTQARKRFFILIDTVKRFQFPDKLKY
jgi:hypothetical protein